MMRINFIYDGCTHDLERSSGIYNLKQAGVYSQLGRLTATIDFLTLQMSLLRPETDLLACTFCELLATPFVGKVRLSQSQAFVISPLTG
ncbi:hypothetical protein [Fibrella forsythiae]|uniref:Uncharacterized protein n=1 Tax=Fibrella forsythiae TaxID=2817061 RepID=A0ABS3JSG9_9BACT|nr:hypothetical protein [Fibrella forsythiae]MBO0952955.1 hypothetical protein [Fibrella forsythiae]